MFKDIKNLFVNELYDLYNCEEQIIEALPKMIVAANSPELKNAFETHLKETREQIRRLDRIFKLLKIEKKEKSCKAARGLIQECKEVIGEFDKSPLRDAALISKAQRIEHYEISAYGTLCAFAKELGLDQVVEFLGETLDEEGNADKKLTKLASGGLFTSGINRQAHEPEEDREAIKPKSTGQRKTLAQKIWGQPAAPRSKRTQSSRSTASRSTSSRARSSSARPSAAKPSSARSTRSTTRSPSLTLTAASKAKSVSSRSPSNRSNSNRSGSSNAKRTSSKRIAAHK